MPSFVLLSTLVSTPRHHYIATTDLDYLHLFILHFTLYTIDTTHHTTITTHTINRIRSARVIQYLYAHGSYARPALLRTSTRQIQESKNPRRTFKTQTQLRLSSGHTEYIVLRSHISLALRPPRPRAVCPLSTFLHSQHPE